MEGRAKVKGGIEMEKIGSKVRNPIQVRKRIKMGSTQGGGGRKRREGGRRDVQLERKRELREGKAGTIVIIRLIRAYKRLKRLCKRLRTV